MVKKGTLLTLLPTETVTITAVIIICVILAIYLTSLKKMGWIGKKEKLYRCPNHECKRIFRKPIELKDLSETPPRIYPACPECGADLGTFFSSRTKNLSKVKPKPLLHQKKLKLGMIEKRSEEKIAEKTKHVPKQVPKLEEKIPSRRTMMSREKKNVTEDSECPYYFGYLASREEVGEIPASCLGCQRSLDCMLAVLKADEPLDEIKKWYQF
jgi:hypothetical protein